MYDFESHGPSFPPYVFVQALRKAYPIFDDKDEKGHHRQQDADECFQSILQSWRGPLKQNGEDLIGKLFEIDLIQEATCAEMPGLPA